MLSALLGSASTPTCTSFRNAGACRDHGAAAGHGFQDHQPEGFLGARVHQRIRRGDPPGQLHAVAAVRKHRHVGRRARLALTADQQQMVRGAEARERLQQHRQVLLAGEAAGVDEHACVARQAEPRAQHVRAALGSEDLHIDTERLVHGVRYSQVLQVRTHQAAGREHHVEALVQPAHVAADRRFREDAAEAPADDLRQVRVVERRERDAAAPRHLPGAPRGMKRVPGLEQRRLQRLEQAHPAARINRQVVVEGAGDRIARNGTHAAALDGAAAAGYDDGVVPGGVRGEPRVFRRQVALHATAGRRIKQGRVDEMHGLLYRTCDPWPAGPRRLALHLYEADVSSVAAFRPCGARLTRA
jgi:hypothetical protein